MQTRACHQHLQRGPFLVQAADPRRVCSLLDAARRWLASNRNRNRNRTPQVKWSRAARTDKGVSAVSQVRPGLLPS